MLENEKLILIIPVCFADRYINYLSKILKANSINFRIDYNNHNAKIYVNGNKYEETLNTIDIYHNHGGHLITENLSWVNNEEKCFPMGYYPIMKVILPQTKYINIADLLYNRLPNEISDYFSRLKEYCAVDDVKPIYSDADNSFLILAKSEISLHDLIVRRAKGFNYVNEYTPFIETYYYSSIFNPPLIEYENNNKKRLNCLKSYFYNSLFYDILKYPSGANIAPHNDNYLHKMGSYGGTTQLEEKNTNVLLDNQLSIEGTFELIDEKGDSYYLDRPYCIVNDSGNFISELSFTEDRVSITTTVNVSRKIKGVDLDGQNDRDAFFTCLDGDDSKGTIIYTEHFVKIADGKRLLHYSDEFDSFEVFNLPHNWFVENGFSAETTGYPKVFDDTTYDKNDEDLNEIFEVMKSTKNHTTKKLGARL